MKERLKRLLLESDPIKDRDLDDDWGDGEIDEIVESLLANGVIVPPVKIGGIVYEVQELYGRVQEYEVVSVLYSNSGFSFGWNLKDGKGFYSNNVLGFTDCDIGKTVFLTREDAKRALAERSDKT